MKQLRQYFKDEKLNKIWNVCREYDKEFFDSQIERPFFFRNQHSFMELAKDAGFTNNFKTDKHVSGNNRILFCKPSEVKMYILDPLHEIEAMLCISPLEQKGLYMHYRCGSALTIVKYEIDTKNGVSNLLRTCSQGMNEKRCVKLMELLTPEDKDATSSFYYYALSGEVPSVTN